MEVKDQTTPGPARLSNAAMAPAIVIAIVGIGTGGACTSDFVRAREATRSYAEHQFSGEALVRQPITNILNNEIEAIKTSLKITVSDIAHCLGVSRQAIYNWKAGSSVKAEHAAKFRNLVAAASTILEMAPDLSPLALRRPLPGGKTLAETVAAGGNGAAAALSLLEMLNSEAQRRADLSARFRGRKGMPSSMVEAASIAEDE